MVIINARFFSYGPLPLQSNLQTSRRLGGPALSELQHPRFRGDKSFVPPADTESDIHNNSFDTYDFKSVHVVEADGKPRDQARCDANLEAPSLC